MNNERLELLIERYKQLYAGDAATIIICNAYSWGKDREGYKALEDWNLPVEWKDYMDSVILRETSYWSDRQVDDDLLPSIRPYYGIAEHSSFFGGRVDYGGDTSYHHPILKSLDDMAAVSVVPHEPHYRMLLESMAYLKEKRGETGLIPSLRGAESPLDIANALRGNDIFLDMYDRPEDVHVLLEKCSEGLKWNLENQLALAEPVEGGIISGYGVWMPGRSVGHISEDTSSMCSLDMYETFGLPYSRKVLGEYDGLFVHVHGMGAHVLPLIMQLGNVQIIQLQDDPNQPAPLEIFKAHEKLLRDTIVMMSMDEKELYDNGDFLKDKRTILQVTPSSPQETEAIVSFVRGLRN